MKQRLNNMIDWFEHKFNFVIDVAALLGGVFLIILALITFVSLILNNGIILESFDFILIPGFIGFLGVMILFALRITRHLTRKDNE